MSKQAYAAFLRTQFWHSMRMEALTLAGFKCAACPSKRRLECHHVLYRRSWYDTRQPDLVVLCDRCHKTAHNSMHKVAYVKDEAERDTFKRELVAHLGAVYLRVRSGFGQVFDSEAARKAKAKARYDQECINRERALIRKAAAYSAELRKAGSKARKPPIEQAMKRLDQLCKNPPSPSERSRST